MIAAAGCGAGFRHERVGTIRTTVGPVGEQEPTLAAVPIAHATDRHRVDVAFYLPRAAEVNYTINCPGQTFEGMVGESWERYRERRLAELERERQREVDAVGALTGAVVGSVGAGARVETPNAEAEVGAEVSGEAVGSAVADSTIPQVQLDPRDVGAQQHERRFELVPGEKGQCTVSIWSETDGAQIQGVTADLTVTRVVDIAAERAASRARNDAIALDVRGEITASLVAAGADPGKRERERRLREAEAERAHQAELARIEHERQQERERRWREQRVAIEYENTIRTGALRVRGRIVGDLVASGCDPHKRDREREAHARLVRQEEERRRRERLAFEERNRAIRVERDERARAERDQQQRVIRAHREEQARLVRQQRDEQARLMQQEQAHGARIRRGALGIRARLVEVLIAGGADPDYQRKRNEAELREFEARAARQRDHQLALEVQFHAALRVREAIRLSLISAGAVDRPVPAPVTVHTPQRVDVDVDVGASVDVSADAAVWVPPIEVVVEGVKVLRPGSWRHKKTGRRVKVRDHRKQKRRR